MSFQCGCVEGRATGRLVRHPSWQLVPDVTSHGTQHRDGSMAQFMDDLVSLGTVGIHPNEKGTLNIRNVKGSYSDRICVPGNVDLNLFGMASAEDVDEEVGKLIRDIGLGGDFIVTSGNSLVDYFKPENVLPLREAVQKYGRYGQ
jgi:hypothetical protein